MKLTGLSYPQEEYITEGTQPARSVRFTTNDCRKTIRTSFLMQNLDSGSPSKQMLSPKFRFSANFKFAGELEKSKNLKVADAEKPHRLQKYIPGAESYVFPCALSGKNEILIIFIPDSSTVIYSSYF